MGIDQAISPIRRCYWIMKCDEPMPSVRSCATVDVEQRRRTFLAWQRYVRERFRVRLGPYERMVKVVSVAIHRSQRWCQNQHAPADRELCKTGMLLSPAQLGTRR
jgi:hypothetical protein